MNFLEETFEMNVSIPEIIRKKRDGLELDPNELKIFVQAVVNRSINEAQIGAMLMAMFLKNLSLRETVALTKAMIASGETLSFEHFNRDILVDKHSTGGVGDKVSIVLTPALAACGLKVPMISGWSLNYTGGTLDKLQSIPGFQVCLSTVQMNECLTQAGCFICCSTKTFAPADSILYGLRDITCTVENVGLIASSILSKKAAEGIGMLIVDVKYGSGAFSKTEEDAEILANTLVTVGKEINLLVKAVISEMNAPLGRYVGNSLEIIESIKCLRNEEKNDLFKLVVFLGGLILHIKGMAETVQEGELQISEMLMNGKALFHFEKMLMSQGVSQPDATALCSGHYWQVLPKATYITILSSSEEGIITKIDSFKVGKACWHLGNGRLNNHSKIEHAAGVILLKMVGDKIDRNEPWIEVHHTKEALSSSVRDLLVRSLVIEQHVENTKKDLTMKLFS